ncbi:hypothetical protein GQ457_04G037870 [Hibiscus cannabinus]
MGRFEPELNQSTLKKQKVGFDAEDRISCLSDDVLVSILSCLPIKVAATTSLLSRRWRMVWTFVPRLEFDASSTLRKIRNRTYGSMRTGKFIDSEKVRFINMVNHFVELYPLPCIEEFRVCFDLNRSHKPDIDKWVKFVFEKKAKRVELDFARIIGLYPLKRSLYTLCPLSLGLPSSIPLTSLVLKWVDVSDQVLDNFLSNSPFLECLCVQRSRTLVHVRVAGPSLHLKSLEISRCPNLMSLQLHATNLLTLKYFGPQIEIPFKNVPNLTTLSIGDYLYPLPPRKFGRILTFFPQLQKLALYIGDVEGVRKRRREFPLMSQLKQMELCVSASDWILDSLLFLSWWMNACPSLHRFALDLMWESPRGGRKIEKGRRIVHHSLKEVEITGFVAEIVDTELCMFLIESAIALEKIVLNPNLLRRKGGPFENKDINPKRALTARKRAEHLKFKYNLGDKLVIM